MIMAKKNSVNNGMIHDLRLMLLARAIDTKAMNLLRQGKTFFHIAGAGHEAIQVVVGSALDPKKDWFFPYYRDLALALSIGTTPYEFFLACFAKADDPSSGGRQLPGHWGHPNVNMPAQSSPTGTQYLNAVGTALASVKTGNPVVSYVSSGEGATSQGEFHEAVNWASREKLPVLFVVQNNKYAISVPVSSQSGGRQHSISEMMAGYDNLLRLKIDGTNYFECKKYVAQAFEYIRTGKGPVLLEAEVVRLLSHSSSDDQRKYRDSKDLEADLKKCPIEFLSKYMIENNLITQKEYENLKKEVAEEINKAADKAILAPDPKPETAVKHILDESGFKDTLEYEKTTPAGPEIVID